MFQVFPCLSFLYQPPFCGGTACLAAVGQGPPPVFKLFPPLSQYSDARSSGRWGRWKNRKKGVRRTDEEWYMSFKSMIIPACRMGKHIKRHTQNTASKSDFSSPAGIGTTKCCFQTPPLLIFTSCHNPPQGPAQKDGHCDASMFKEMAVAKSLPSSFPVAKLSSPGNAKRELYQNTDTIPMPFYP